MIDRYSAGYLNDFGGGNVLWWQDYLRAELDRAHDFYASQFPQWIPVSDRMPEPGDYSVLCAFSNGSVEPIRMEHVEDWAQGLRDDYLKITHWMPLPTPPVAE